MFKPGDIIYGFAKGLYRPKYKYAVSIFRDCELNILAQFTTSQERRGYLIEAGKIIGKNPFTGAEFSFPKRTIMAYDYGFLYGSEQKLVSQFDHPEIVCRMNKDEYINLVYALYKSDYTPTVYKPFLEKVLEDYYK